MRIIQNVIICWPALLRAIIERICSYKLYFEKFVKVNTLSEMWYFVENVMGNVRKDAYIHEGSFTTELNSSKRCMQIKRKNIVNQKSALPYFRGVILTYIKKLCRYN